MQHEEKWEKIKGYANCVLDHNEMLVNYLDGYKNRYLVFPASAGHHHAYDGGFYDHIIEVIEFSFTILNMLFNKMKITIDEYHVMLSDMIFAILLHDIQKLTIYMKDIDGKWFGSIAQKDAPDHFEFPIVDWKEKTGTDLPDNVARIIRTPHGGWGPQKFSMRLLDCVVHAADLISSRL